MTTQKQPAEQPAATDQADQHSPAEDQTSPVDTASSAASAADADPGLQTPASELPPSQAPADEAAASGVAAGDAAPSPEAAARPAAGTGEAASGPGATGESASPQVGAAPSSAGPESETTGAAPGPSQRRVRLNPTVAPEVARPIPSLRPSEPPSPPAPQAPATPQPPVGQPATSAVAQTTPPAPAEAQSPPASESQSEADEAAAAAEQSAEAATVPPPPPPEPVELPGRNEALDADLEAELEAALSAGEQPPSAAGIESQVSAASPAEGAEQPAAATAVTPDMELKQGVKLTGTVASIHGDDMFLDFGLRMPGVLSRRQFGLRKQPMQGESLEIVVGRIDENEGLIHVNLPTGTSRVRGEWDALSVDQNLECMVTGTNKGGLEVSIGALRGFMPASQVELGFVPDLNVYIGQRLKARITEVNPKRRKLVLSRRSLLEEEREESQRELFEKIEPGQQYTGRVRTLKDYGAFVDIGGADGLLHVAQISWSRINHPSEVLKEGEEIQVQVLSVDKDKKKISLGMRQLTQNPWKSAESKFAQGSQVKGKVTRIENFGAFVELEEGVEGLVHISELDHKRVNKVSEVLRVGQEVEVQVLDVDPKRKRVSLSLKALKEKPEDAQDKAEATPIKRQRSVDSLVGGIGEPTGGKLFGDPSKFGR